MSVRIAVAGAMSADRLDASALVDAVAGYEPLPSARVVGGNQRVATAIADRLVAGGARLRLGEPVRAVTWRTPEGDVDAASTVRTDRGELEADAVVVAVPFTLVDEIAFDPPLPAWKRDAVAAIGTGQAAKLHVALTTAVRPFAITSVSDSFWCWAATDGGGPDSSVVASFSGSLPALDALAVDAGPARWLERLTATVPQITANPSTDALLSTWQDDPWARCAYTAVLAGHVPDTAAIAAPVGPLFFAGEHTAGDLAGLMEGALRSGARAAREISATGR
jgi:monoamine oxidase